MTDHSYIIQKHGDAPRWRWMCVCGEHGLWQSTTVGLVESGTRHVVEASCEMVTFVEWLAVA
jgi:hypothetical protein